MTDFQKKYTPNNIQQESLAQQNRKNLWSNKGRKTAKEKNTVTIVQTPIELEPHTTSYEQFFWLIKEDAIARYLRMMGKQVNTCPIFSYKTTTSDGEKENIKMPQWERLMTKEKEKWIKYMIQLGFAYDETSEKTIFSPLYMRKIRNLIVHFTQKGWIYKDYAINYRSNRLQTNIASDDIVRKRIKDKIYNIRYFVDTKNITIVVSTTTPETIFGDVALAVHPEDRRYKKLIGSKVIIPIINKTIPIIADEAVDAGSENGIIRVTPCHDKLGLDIAKRHNLKLNKFAIDHQGCFTKAAGDFHGKKVGEFFENIIQNLDDIHNLESTQMAEYEVATDKHYGDKLQPIIGEQRFFHHTQESESEKMFQEYIEQTDIQPQEYQEEVKETWARISTSRAISKKDSFGIPLPLRQDQEEKQYFLSEQNILDLPKTRIKNKKIIPALLLFNLIADQRLPKYFTIEELIDKILDSYGEGKCIGEAYMERFAEDLPRGYKKEINEFAKLFEYAGKEKGLNNFEKFGMQLMNILEKTFAVINRKNGKYAFDFSVIARTDEEIFPSNEKIDNTIATNLMLLDIAGYLENQESETTMFFANERELNNSIKMMLLGISIRKKKTLEHIFFYPESSQLSGDVLEEMLNQWGADSIRLYSILSSSLTQNRQKTEYPEIHFAFIHKMRNAYRYIFTTCIQHPKKKTSVLQRKKEEKRDLEILETYIEKRLTKANTAEYRMICRIKELYEELADYRDKNNITAFAQKLIRCIQKDFCEKYLEIIKLRTSDITNQVAVFCTGMLLKMVYPILPFASEKIWEMYNFKGNISGQKLTFFFQKASKNYKTQLFMDIIDKFALLRERINQPKHQKVDICFNASTDFLHYLKDNEDIIQKLVNTEKIEYIDKEKDLQKYETENIIDVIIGIKAISKPIKEEGFYILEQTLAHKQEELQKIRNITSRLSLDKKEKKAIASKKEEMNKLKAEIEKLEYEINKIKMNEK